MLLDQASTPESFQEGLNAPYTSYTTPSPAYSQLTNFCISITLGECGLGGESCLGTKEFRVPAKAWGGAVHVRALRGG